MLIWPDKTKMVNSLARTVNREGDGTPLQCSCLENPMDGGAWWAAVHGVAEGRTRLSNFTFTFHFHALEKEMATHSSVLAWRIPGTGEPGGLLSMGSHRVGHNWSDLAAAAAGQLNIQYVHEISEYFIIWKSKNFKDSSFSEITGKLAPFYLNPTAFQPSSLSSRQKKTESESKQHLGAKLGFWCEWRWQVRGWAGGVISTPLDFFLKTL